MKNSNLVRFLSFTQAKQLLGALHQPKLLIGSHLLENNFFFKTEFSSREQGAKRTSHYWRLIFSMNGSVLFILFN